MLFAGIWGGLNCSFFLSWHHHHCNLANCDRNWLEAARQLFCCCVKVTQPCRQAFTVWHYSIVIYSPHKNYNVSQEIQQYSDKPLLLLLFLLEPQETRLDTISICLPTSSNDYFYFFIGKSSTFIWKWNKWQTFQPPGAPSCGQDSKAGQPDECPAKASWRGVKKTLLKWARRLSKNQPLASAHQEGAGACLFPWRGRANGRPQCLHGGKAGEEECWGDGPRTQWCFRAESIRPSQACSIPSPTVTPGTRLSPFKHIICAHMAAKRHTLRSFTHPVPPYCCSCRLPCYYRAIKGFGWRTTPRHMPSWSVTSKLKDNRILAHLQILFFFASEATALDQICICFGTHCGILWKKLAHWFIWWKLRSYSWEHILAGWRQNCCNNLSEHYGVV